MARSRLSGNYTTDHDEIRRWVEERGGHPAHVKRRTRGQSDVGILRIDFPGYSGARTLEAISWDEFFKAFDENGLAFLHADKTAGGKVSRFNKLVARETAEAREHGVKTSRHHPARKRAAATATGTRRAAGKKTTAREKTGRRGKTAKRTRKSA